MNSFGRTARIAWHFGRARWRWARLNERNLHTFHNERMRRITAYAHAHSPFYRQHWRDHDLADWRTLPLVDKRLMMDHFSTFNTCGIERERAMTTAIRAEHERDFAPTVDGLTVGLSSGTSGHRGLFLASVAEQMAWAGTILARMLPLRSRPTTIAFFLRSNSNLYEQVGGRLVRFRYFDLMLPLEQAISQLNALQPYILIGPPSLLHMLASELHHSLHIAPERLISVAEVLEPHDQTYLQTAFGVAVGQIYQCTEGLIAASCAHGALHIQEDVVALQAEPLPNDPDRFVPIVSDLWRTTQPIVRYRLDDVLRLQAAPCACGSAFRVLASIEGRCDDLFYFPTSGGAARPVFPDLIRRMILLASAEISDYQAIQDHVGQIEVRLVLRDAAAWADVARDVHASIVATLATHACSASAITILPELLPRTPDAKRRRVIRRDRGSGIGDQETGR